MKYKKTILKYLKLFADGTKDMFKGLKNKDKRKYQIANIISFQRLVLPFIIIPISLIGAFNGIMPLLITSTVLTSLGGISDMFDGKIARKYNITSEYGEFLDQITDKFFSGSIAIGLSLINPLFLISVSLELIIASINIFYKSKYPNIKMKSSMIGKIKQWPLSATIAFGFLAPINNLLFDITKIAIIISAMFQSATAIDYTVNQNKQVKKICSNCNDEKTNMIDYANIKDEKKEVKEKKITYYNSTKITNEKNKVKVKVKKIK